MTWRVPGGRTVLPVRPLARSRIARALFRPAGGEGGDGPLHLPDRLAFRAELSCLHPSSPLPAREEH
ncbi:hypothetical protein DC522_06600 [Microvirga sp. KLBC 81]|nr:hypothetical protein DC522_06600 [Microvirga sp. KLBC 81]